MGVGKSTVGPLLAEKLSATYLDTDLLVLKKAGGSVAEIFAQEGEAGFRTREREALFSLKDKTFTGAWVISLGGGVLNSARNFDFVNQTGTLIYLVANAKTLGERLKESAESRPLLTGLSEEKRQQKIVTLLKERAPIYEKAKLQVPTDGKDAKAVAQKIFELLMEKPQ
jgi:shikimate kinase